MWVFIVSHTNNKNNNNDNIRKQGWPRSGESACRPLMWLGFHSWTRGHIGVLQVFLPPQKTNITNFQLDLESEDHRFVSCKADEQSRFVHLV